MNVGGLQAHPVHDVEPADIQARGMLTEQPGCPPPPGPGMSPAAASTTSGSPSWSLLAQRQIDTGGEVCLTAASNVEPLELRLLVDDDQIDVIPARKQ
jgi:hypothetical protein